MSAIEVTVGEFEPAVVRIRYSAAGRPFLRLTSTDGLVEELYLEIDLKHVAVAADPRLGEEMNRWLLGRDAEAAMPAARDRDEGGRRGPSAREHRFVMVLRDGRKIGARATRDIVAELRSFSAEAPVAAQAVPMARRHGLVPSFLSRLLAQR